MSSDLLAQIASDYTTAYKAKEQQRLDVLRLLKTAMTMVEKDVRRPLTDDDAMQVLLKEAKQRKDSIAEFTKAGRQDLADKEAAELKILEAYLPEPLSEDELAAAVDAALEATGATSMKDMGTVMQQLMDQYKGRVDGKKASALVRSRLSS